MDKQRHIRDIGDVRRFVLTKLPCIYGICLIFVHFLAAIYWSYAAPTWQTLLVLQMLSLGYIVANIWMVWYLLRRRETGGFLTASMHWGLTALCFLLGMRYGGPMPDNTVLWMTFFLTGPFYPLFYLSAQTAAYWGLLLFSVGMFGISLYGLARRKKIMKSSQEKA